MLFLASCGEFFIAGVQELTPTSDTALVRSLMNLIDCLTDEFYDESKLEQFSERETSSWLEVLMRVLR